MRRLELILKSDKSLRSHLMVKQRQKIEVDMARIIQMSLVMMGMKMRKKIVKK